MGAARGVWSEAEHHRGYHGRFAAMGALKVVATEPGNRPGDNREPSIRRAAAAFHPRASASARRNRKTEITDAANRVNDTYAQLQRGTADWRAREKISWQSPKKRAEQTAKTGDVVMPHAEALRRNVGMVRDIQKPTPRVGVGRTFTGKPKVVRGNGPELGVPLTNRGKQMLVSRSDLTDMRDVLSTKGKKGPAAAKMAPRAITPAMRQQFALTSDQHLRAMAKALPGVAVPPRAGRNQLIDLILAHR